jgi:hypothetical protein
MAFYGDIEKAAQLAGVDSQSVLDIMTSVINEWIDSNIRNFGNHEVEEYYSVTKDNVTELVLKNFPIITLNSVIDDADESNGGDDITDSVLADKESGILYLDRYRNGISSFTKGIHSVKVNYKYGYLEVPQIIKDLATMALAKWLDIINSSSDKDSDLKSVRIGDYQETYDMSFMSIKTKYDGEITMLYKGAKNKYCVIL